MGNKLGVFLAGGLVGAVAALLCAPRTGSETRNMVAEKANAVWGEAQELGAQTASTAQQVVEEVKKYFPRKVFKTVIPRTVRLSEAPGFGQPVLYYDRASKGAEAYGNLAKEILKNNK